MHTEATLHVGIKGKESSLCDVPFEGSLDGVLSSGLFWLVKKKPKHEKVTYSVAHKSGGHIEHGRRGGNLWKFSLILSLLQFCFCSEDFYSQFFIILPLNHNLKWFCHLKLEQFQLLCFSGVWKAIKNGGDRDCLALCVKWTFPIVKSGTFICVCCRRSKFLSILSKMVLADVRFQWINVF